MSGRTGVEPWEISVVSRLVNELRQIRGFFEKGTHIFVSSLQRTTGSESLSRFLPVRFSLFAVSLCMEEKEAQEAYTTTN